VANQNKSARTKTFALIGAAVALTFAAAARDANAVCLVAGTTVTCTGAHLGNSF
jgi:hypothetical protein